jgi:hypothetical protein
MNLFTTMGLISTIALFLPIIMLLVFKLAWHKSFPALFGYYVLILSYNLVNLEYIPFKEPSVVSYHRITTHLLEIPLILLFFTYFSKTAAFRKNLLIANIIFVVFEIGIVAVFGYTSRAITIILAPGLCMVLFLSSVFFLHQVKIAVIHHKAIGKAVMIASLLFAYAGYAFVYVVNYIVNTPDKMDAYLIYFLITIVTSVPMCIGIYVERRRVQQLSELQTTREELKKIYGSDRETTTAANPFGRVALNYENDQWN